MKEYCLEDLFDLQMGKTPARENDEYWNAGNNDWISIRDLSGYDKYVSQTKEQLTDMAIAESGIKEIPSNTVVMSFKLSIGKLAITTEKIYSNEAIMAFIDKRVEKISSDYLYYLLLSKDWNEGTNKAVMGKTLNKATLSKVKIKLHENSEQEKIVSVLDKANKLITLRKKQLLDLDNLIKSRFVEMFGDPVHPLRFSKLGDVALLERGRFSPRPRNDPKYFNGDYPFIQTGDIANCNHRLSDYKQTLNECGIKVSKLFKGETIVIAIVGATIGATAILEREVYAPDSVIGISTKKGKCVPIFLETLLQFWQPELQRMAPDSARANINLAILKEIPIVQAEIKLQEEFSDFVQITDKLKLAMQKSIDETQILFNSLMQKYFGE